MSEHKDHSESVYIPFSILPEGRLWKNGKSYRVKAVLKQISTDEDGAEFDVVDATSLEAAVKENDERRRVFSSDGYLKA